MTEKLRVLEAFSGVGTQRMALRNIGVDHEVVAISEIDRFAIASYEAIHGKTFNLGDISHVKVEDVPDCDLFTYSFPCQAVSVSGKQEGLAKGSGTTSSLLWECQKVIEGKMPKYLLMENVKNLVSKKFKPFFDEWLEYLESLGYTNYWKVLNGKDYGVPQNRERVFVVSILGEHEPYEFPEPQPLIVRLRDILDEEVDEKFYLKEEQTERLIQNSNYFQDLVNEPKINILAHRKNYRRNTQVFDPNGITETLDTGQGGGRGHYTISNSGISKIGNVNPSGNGMNGNVFHADGLSPTITTNKGEGHKVFIHQPDRVVIAASRGRNPENSSDRTVGAPTEQRLEINKQGTSNTITTVQKDNYVVEQVRRLAEKARPNDEIGVSLRLNGDIRPHRMDVKKSGIQELNIDHEDNPSHTVTTTHMPKVYGGITNFRIRKLTPKECFRLMGISDEDFYKAESVNSNSQLYKQAGNAIIVPVLEGIFSQLF